MSTAKEEVRKLLDRLPEDATLEEIQYRLFVRGKIERALGQVAAGETMSTEDAERQLARPR